MRFYLRASKEQGFATDLNLDGNQQIVVGRSAAKPFYRDLISLIDRHPVLAQEFGGT